MTVDEVITLFNRLVFADSRRLNVKVYSQMQQAEDRSASQILNEEFRSKFGLKHRIVNDIKQFQNEHELWAKL